MSISINGMEMPKQGFVEILIRDDGTVQQTGQSYRVDGTDYYTPYVGEMPVMYKAVPVPQHGDLIERDALIEALAKMVPWAIADPSANAFLDGLSAAYEAIKAAPTIISASEEGE